MKINAVRPLAILAFAAVLRLGQAQTVSDLLRGIQPGATAPTASEPAPVQPPANPSPAATPAPAFDTKPAFMSIVTNLVRLTNQVITTNYVVVTNATFTTNFFNAQGQILMPVQPTALPAQVAVESPAKPAAPDPAVVRSNRLQAVRELLSLSVAGASNTLSVPASFSGNANYQIRLPDGLTSFDRKKGQNLAAAMNAAAEKSVGPAMAIVGKTASHLTHADPAQLLQAGNDAATRYLLSTQGQDLSNQILAVVQVAAAEARVPEAYNAVMVRGGGLLGAVLGTSPSIDINAHITRGLMEAMFLNVSSEENRVRADPSARKTKALQEGLAK